MITKQDRLEILKNDKELILQWLSDRWDNLLEDSAINDVDEFFNGDTRSTANLYQRHTGNGSAQVTFRFFIDIREVLSGGNVKK
jgi:virulence-associated protein VagC